MYSFTGSNLVMVTPLLDITGMCRVKLFAVKPFLSSRCAAWFQRSKAGNKNHENEPGSGKPTEILLDDPKKPAYHQHLVCGIFIPISVVPRPWTMENDFSERWKLGQWLPYE